MVLDAGHMCQNLYLACEAIGCGTCAIAAYDQKEIDEMDVADFGLNNLMVEGGQMLTFFNTDRVSAKVIALFPGQTLPEHWHTAFGKDPGKEETIRAVWGTLYFYKEGKDTLKMAKIPKEKEDCYTAREEYIMTPGSQITIEPGVKHWFQAGEEGAVSCLRKFFFCKHRFTSN